MSKAKDYIEAYTNRCSNHLVSVADKDWERVVSYREWLTPDNALRAVEIEREEVIEKACDVYCKYCKENSDECTGTSDCSWLNIFKQAMKGE